MAVYNPSKNPILQNANLKLFLAYKDGEVVGRVALKNFLLALCVVLVILFWKLFNCVYASPNSCDY
jgi:hypothetical protein